jgi:hypothetical protein
MDWADICRWHTQVQRIQSDRAQLAHITSQLATLSTLSAAQQTEEID